MEKKTYFHRVHDETPTRFWINNVTREQARLAIDAGAVGCTQNPAYTWKMMTSEQEIPYVNEQLDQILATESDDNEALIKLQKVLIARVATVFEEVYEKTNKRWGYVSIQGDPFHEDVNTIVNCAVANTKDNPNMMAKIPVTKDGLEAIEYAASKRIPINATECMGIRQVIDVCEAYTKVTKGMKDKAPLYYSLITGIFDEYLQKQVAKENIDVNPDYLWQAGMAVARKVYKMVKDAGYDVGFIGGGARGLHHFTEMVGADAVITINWNGTADKLIEQDPPVVQRFFMPTDEKLTDHLMERLPDFRRAYLLNGLTEEEFEDYGPVVLFRSSFESAWKNALKYVEDRRALKK